MHSQFTIIPPSYGPPEKTQFIDTVGPGTYTVPSNATKLRVTLKGPSGPAVSDTSFDTLVTATSNGVGGLIISFTNGPLPATFDYVVGEGGPEDSDGFIIIEAYFD